MVQKLSRNKRKTPRKIKGSPSTMKGHTTAKGTPTMDNKTSSRQIDNEMKRHAEKRGEDPSIIGTIVSTLPSPSSLSHNSTNAANERQGCDTLFDQPPRSAEISSNEDWKEQIVAMVTAQGKRISEQDERISGLTTENKTLKDKVAQLDERISGLTTENKTLKNKIAQQGQQISILTKEMKTLQKKVSQVETELEQVKSEVHEHRDITTTSEIAKEFSARILRNVLEHNPSLKTDFKGQTLRDLKNLIRDSPAVLERAKASNHGDKGFSLESIAAVDEACAYFGNRLNQRRFSGYRTTSKRRVAKKIGELAKRFKKQTRAELAMISQQIDGSPQVSPQK